jgi:hypothetical protein
MVIFRFAASSEPQNQFGSNMRAIPTPTVPMRCKARPWSDNETANFHGWYISATKLSGGDFDLNTI